MGVNIRDQKDGSNCIRTPWAPPAHHHLPLGHGRPEDCTLPIRRAHRCGAASRTACPPHTLPHAHTAHTHLLHTAISLHTLHTPPHPFPHSTPPTPTTHTHTTCHLFPPHTLCPHCVGGLLAFAIRLGRTWRPPCHLPSKRLPFHAAWEHWPCAHRAPSSNTGLALWGAQAEAVSRPHLPVLVWTLCATAVQSQVPSTWHSPFLPFSPS